MPSPACTPADVLEIFMNFLLPFIFWFCLAYSNYIYILSFIICTVSSSLSLIGDTFKLAILKFFFVCSVDSPRRDQLFHPNPRLKLYFLDIKKNPPAAC